MKILVLAWEFPPRIVGGIARHVAELYPELVTLGHEVHLLTVACDSALGAVAPTRELVDGIHVYRAPIYPDAGDFLHWIGHMNERMGYFGGEILLKEGAFDLIHAHDWLVGDAAIALQQHFNLPLITTVHATEHGRNGGIYSDTQWQINVRERELIHRSWRVIVCTQYMQQEVSAIHRYSGNAIDVVANGIRAEKKRLQADFDIPTFRRRYAEDDEKIFYYVGRITYEKGISVLLNAAHRVLHQLKGKLVIIGGGNTDHLQRQARMLGIADRCVFTGFMSEEDLDRFQAIADCAVFPSLYEPFGIVALESFAARVPLVVSDAGGLPEVVRHRETGIVTERGNVESLAQGILDVLEHRVDTQRLVQRAYAELEGRFSWAKLAKQTEKSYEVVATQYQQSSIAS
ncbi:MAG: glycosyltransferase family 4 protein [Synechococcales cyanobacterium CRU_2_2]|nr:glycosyltransferase family 4 protein [Synechococcales cyanobacterium CRU_2_2]